ncbi:nicotinate-nucleotide--dimethylbenzimidazole phosphoribosyltransferase [Sulfobacillus sp. hq2]|uniref:nicotinate-nucleotide--dimethylbenzimidazole phosphoribosyltransferase n=1 Tax=Sulfobacillus TaxID=28033 RepID=UPI000CD2C80C|nr:nicotinate-nucleotide--dimethylbenzimidazole phosphoribosyltransferase [Sulfobacillus sp. hq2]POB09427.1 5,6-dimethylbenzimidazole synthase [Sulfobacillus sp. hq2]
MATTLTDLDQVLNNILPKDRLIHRDMQNHLDALIKPPGSLGRLERLACQLASAERTLRPAVDPAITLIYAGDHGVASLGVSQYPASVTAQMLSAYQHQFAAISVLARHAGSVVKVIDVGVNGEWTNDDRDKIVVSQKIRPGTRNFVDESAMTPDECLMALTIGIQRAEAAHAQGYRAILLGEVGIGNTTIAAALASALLNESPRTMTGHGTGIDQDHWEHKIRTVEAALKRHHRPDLEPFDVLTRLGGYEVAAMVGTILGAAQHHIVTILDGYLTGVAALLAVRLAPAAVDYLVASHQSAEPGHGRVLSALGLNPLLEWGLRLGEGSGAALALPLLRQACAIASEMATFEEAGLTETPAPLESPWAITRHQFSWPERAAVYRAIESRRDIRQFRSDPVPPEILERLLWAAHHAPSVGFSQPWDFILITDPAIKQQLKSLADRERQVQKLYFDDDRAQQFLQLKLEGLLEAPIVLVITANLERGGPEVLGRHTMEETTLYSAVCAVQNLWLAARAEGVAVGWVSLFEPRHLRQVLEIPPGIQPVAVLCVGYTDHFPPEPQLKTVRWADALAVKELVHWQTWTGTTPPTL